MEVLKRRLVILLFVPVAFFLVFSARFWYLQIHRGEEFRRFSEKNVLRVLRLPAPRGLILDRNGAEIVRNRPSFNVQVLPREVTDMDGLAERLSGILGVSRDGLVKKLEKPIRLGRFAPVTVAPDISRDELLLVEKNMRDLHGVMLEIGYKRSYPHGRTAAAVLGYTGEASGEEIRANPQIVPGAQVGKMGVEKFFDGELRGKSGIRYVPVDAYGKVVSDSFSGFKGFGTKKELVAGKDLSLSIDLELQKAAEKSLGKEKGSIVVMDVRNGEILAMANRPSFDPEDFSKGLSPAEWKKIRGKESFSLLNRSTRGTYPPGSVVKMVTAFSILEEKVQDPGSVEDCPGYHVIGDTRFNCWRKEGHGLTDLRDAVVKSCDVYFYKLSLKLGMEKFSRHLRKFGFGERTGLELPEKPGLVPSRKWKRDALGEPWYRGETAMLAIGQGHLTVTPLQVGVMTSTVANGGRVLVPTIRKGGGGKAARVVGEGPGGAESKKFVRDALKDVVNADGGTGVLAKSRRVSVSGKTGTAQVVSAKVESTRKRFRDHAWFTSYAPSDSPEISVTVLVENGGQGGSVAAPRARKIIETYFRLKNERNDV